MADCYQAVLPSGLVIDIACSADLFVFTELFANQEYQEPVRDLCDMWLPKDERSVIPRVLDIGGNVGFFTLYCANELLKHDTPDFEILAIEASQASVDEFIQRIRAQRLPALVGRVTVLHGLAGHTSGSAPLLIDPLHTLGYVLKPGETSPKPTIDTPYLNLNELAPGPWDLMKLDIEGHEEIFLEHHADLLMRCQAVVAELHHESINVGHVMHLMREYGFDHLQQLRDGTSVTIQYWTRS